MSKKLSETLLQIDAHLGIETYGAISAAADALEEKDRLIEVLRQQVRTGYKLPPGGYGNAYHSPDDFLPPEDVDVVVELEDGKRMVASHHNGFFTKSHGGPLIEIDRWRYITREDTIFFKCLR